MSDAARANKRSGLAGKLYSGAIAGVVGTSIIYPMDMVKSQLQTSSKFTGMLDCFKQMISAGGVKSLYRGLIPNLLGIAPEKAIKLAVNDYVREHMGTRYNVAPERLSALPSMMAGATAGVCQVVVTNPMEIVKIQMQLGSKSMTQIVRSLGLAGLYKGTIATLARDVPFSMVFFPTAAFLKGLYPKESPPLYITFASGVVAGALAAASVTPMGNHI